MNLSFKIFVALYFMSLSAFSQQFSADFLPKWERTKAYTLAVAEAMPEDKYSYKPVEEVFTFQEQLNHLIGNFASLQSFVSGSRETPLKQGNATKAETIASLNAAFDYIGTMITELNDESAWEKTNFFRQEVNMNKKGVFELMRNHVTHHRGQCILYLRMNGIEPPKYVGW